MKGLPGILIAAGLGIIGAFCNWFYINNQARNYQGVAFVAISGDAEVEAGEEFLEEHFVPVEVPQKFVGELTNTAVLWKDRMTAVGVTAIKTYRDGEILLRNDLETIAGQHLTERLGPDEVPIPVVVDPATFIPQHYNPGDEVEFFVPQMLDTAPTPTSASQPAAADAPATVGRFRILSLGNRMGRWDIAAAYDRRPERENVITIALKFPFDAKAKELFRLMGAAGNRGLRMFKHKPETESESEGT